MARLIFRSHHVCIDRGCMALLGSLREFGDWNPVKGIRASQHPEGTWEAEVHLIPGQNLEFKWVVLYGNGLVKWEDRPNRCIKTPIKDTIYTSLWNEELQTTEIKTTGHVIASFLRNRKREVPLSPSPTPLPKPEDECMKYVKENTDSYHMMDTNLPEDMKKTSSLNLISNDSQFKEAGKYTNYTNKGIRQVFTIVGLLLFTLLYYSL